MTKIAYTTLADLKTFLEITANDAATNAMLNNIIAVGGELLDLELGGNLGEEAITDRYVNGSGTNRLIFENTVTGVSKIEYKVGSQWYTADLDRIDDCFVYVQQTLPRGIQNVRISFTKGMASVPADLKYFFHFYCKILYDNEIAKTTTEQGSKGIKSKSLESLSITYFSPGELADTELGRRNSQFLINYDKILNKYKNFSIKIA